MADKYTAAVGRRKEASARAKLTSGKGEMTINGKSAVEYLGNDRLVKKATMPLEAVSLTGKYDVAVIVRGGGLTGQTEAIRHAIARALVKEDETLKSTLRKLGFITRDPRMKERKKPGYKGARKKPQFSKR
jgi:small subunit ribosomal protein S9